MPDDPMIVFLLGFAAGVLACVLCWLLAWLIAPWARGVLTRVNVPLVQVLGMRLRGTPPGLIIDALISLKMRGHTSDARLLSRVESVYLEDRQRYRDGKSLADAVLGTLG